MGKGNRKDEEKKEEEKEKKVSSTSLNLSLPKIAGSEDEAGESASADRCAELFTKHPYHF